MREAFAASEFEVVVTLLSACSPVIRMMLKSFDRRFAGHYLQGIMPE